MLAHPGLGRSGHAEQQQGPIGSERRHRDLDEPLLADILRRNHRAVGELTAQQVPDHGPRRHLPTRRPRTIIVCAQCRQFVGELLLSVRPQDFRIAH